MATVPTENTLFRVGGEYETYHVRSCDVYNSYELLKANDLFVGVPWEANKGKARNLGFVSRHLKGVDLQHYRAPLLTAPNPISISDWAFDPYNPRKLAVAAGDVHFYSIEEESRTAHKLLEPVHSISNANAEAIQIQYNPAVAVMAVLDSRDLIRLYDIEAMAFAANASEASRLEPVAPSATARPRRRTAITTTRIAWNSDNKTLWASFSDGNCALIDPKCSNLEVLRLAPHQLNTSNKPATIIPLTHENFFLSSGHYQGRLEIKLWDQRLLKPAQPLQTIDLGSTSSPACMITDEDCRHLFANARGDCALRHFSLYDTQTHSPQIVLKDSYYGPRSNIRQLTMVPKTQWQHHRNEIAQILKSDGTVIETLHVYDKTAKHASGDVYSSPAKTITKSGNLKLSVTSSQSKAEPTIPRQGSQQTSSTSGSQSLRVSGSLPVRTKCCMCGLSLSASNSGLRGSRSGALPEPSVFSGCPETFERAPCLSCAGYLASEELLPRKRVPITPWGDLTSDIASEFLNADLADHSLLVGGVTPLPVHKCILSVRSPYFKRQFEGLPAEVTTTTLGEEMKGVLIPDIVFDRVLFYIYTDALPISIIEAHEEALTVLAQTWELFQLSRWIDAWKLNKDDAPYFSFFLHQLHLLRSKPDAYHADLALIPGEFIPESIEHSEAEQTSPAICEECKVHAKPLRAHRLFAGARHAFIRRILVSGMKETFAKEIKLDLLSRSALLVFISFLYSNELEAEDPNDLMDLWAAGEAYFMPNLVAACEMTIRPLVDVDNCVALYERAGLSATYLRTFLANYICTHFSFLTEDLKSQLDADFRADVEANFVPIKSTITVHADTTNHPSA